MSGLRKICVNEVNIFVCQNASMRRLMFAPIEQLSEQEQRVRGDAIATSLMHHVPRERLHEVGQYLRDISFWPSETAPAHVSTTAVPSASIPSSSRVSSLGYVVPMRARSSLPTSRRPWKIDILRHHDFLRPLHGTASQLLQPWDASIHGIPREPVPIGVDFTIWGRRWSVRQSMINPDMGLSVFSVDDIIVPHGCARAHLPELFPFSGPMYSDSHWRSLSRQCSSFGRYALRVRHNNPIEQFIDGFPGRVGGLAGYVNSSRGLGRSYPPNAEWVEHIRGHRLCHLSVQHVVVTVAIRSIRAGDEILVDYPWRRIWTYSSTYTSSP